MNSLSTFQRKFTHDLLSPRGPSATFDHPAFAVYRNTWRKALCDALAANYPVIAALVGEEAFRALGLQFGSERAAPGAILAGYGDAFPAFLATHQFRHSLPYLHEVAQLERLVTEAHLAPDADPLPGISCPGPLNPTARGLQFVMHPSTRSAWFETPAVTIWEAHQGGEVLEEFAPAWIAEGALVVRRSGATRVEQIDRAGHRLVSGLGLGETLGEAADATSRLYPEADIPSLFQLLASSGALLPPAGKKG